MGEDARNQTASFYKDVAEDDTNEKGIRYLDHPIEDWEPKSSSDRTGLGFAAADMLLRSLGLESLGNAVARAKLDGLLVLWHPAQ